MNCCFVGTLVEKTLFMTAAANSSCTSVNYLREEQIKFSAAIVNNVFATRVPTNLNSLDNLVICEGVLLKYSVEMFRLLILKSGFSTTGNSTILNQFVAGSIIVRHIK